MEVLNKTPEFFARQWGPEAQASRKEETDALFRPLLIEVKDRISDIEDTNKPDVPGTLRKQEIESIFKYFMTCYVRSAEEE